MSAIQGYLSQAMKTSPITLSHLVLVGHFAFSLWLTTIPVKNHFGYVPVSSTVAMEDTSLSSMVLPAVPPWLGDFSSHV